MTAVLVTRPGGAEDQLVTKLESRGYRVLAVPTVLTRPTSVAWPNLATYDWIVLTSAAGVAALPNIPAGPMWAAVGESTARALHARGAEVDLVPPDSNGAAISDAMPNPRGMRMLLVRASLADSDLPTALRKRGARVDEVIAYETIEAPAECAEPLQRALLDSEIAAVVFASGSAVRGFVKLGGPITLPAITIGPKTSTVAREAGFSVIGESRGASVRQLTDAVELAIPIEVKKDA